MSIRIADFCKTSFVVLDFGYDNPNAISTLSVPLSLAPPVSSSYDDIHVEVAARPYQAESRRCRFVKASYQDTWDLRDASTWGILF
jgi:hypothetical protein